MISYLTILITIVPVIGIGHFYFGYTYYLKKEGSIKTILLTILSCIINFILYATTRSLFPESSSLMYFYIFVVFLFILHHVYDTYRFGHIRQSFISLLIGIIALYCIFTHSILNTIGAFLIWGLILYHYSYWIFITTKKTIGLQKKIFLEELIIVHGTFLALLCIHTFYELELVTVLFSLNTFHHLTSIHIIFSTLKEIPYIKNTKNLKIQNT